MNSEQNSLKEFYVGPSQVVCNVFVVVFSYVDFDTNVICFDFYILLTIGLTHANIIEIARIAAENLLLADDRYGQFSIEFVMATTYVLAILEQVIRLEKLCNRSDHCENEKIIRELFNMKIIEKSYTILSPLMKKIFRTAIREVQHKVTCYR